MHCKITGCDLKKTNLMIHNIKTTRLIQTQNINFSVIYQCFVNFYISRFLQYQQLEIKKTISKAYDNFVDIYSKLIKIKTSGTKLN